VSGAQVDGTWAPSVVRRNLRVARDALNLSQAEAADLVGVAQSTVAMHELGSREMNLSRLQAYADAYAVTVADLVDPMFASRVTS
jgi:transcriptional regulator with XRE-family HTH domain